MKANEKHRLLIPEMSILPMMRICSSFPALVVELFSSCGNLLFILRSLLILLFAAREPCFIETSTFVVECNDAYAFHSNNYCEVALTAYRNKPNVKKT
jgi:hypothetical protein